MTARLTSRVFDRFHWLIAWRHLRTGDNVPTWVRPLIYVSLYLLLVGGGMTLYAAGIAGPNPTELGPPLADLDLVQGEGPTALQRYYGTIGAVTLILGIMGLVFGILAWAFALLPTIITMSVLLGCMALVVVLSLMSGLEGDLRDKILAQNAHVRVSRTDARPFADYEQLADSLAEGEGVAGASPYLEGEVMVRSGLNRQGAILIGIIPERHTAVTNLQEIVRAGDYDYLVHPEQIPRPDPFALDDDNTPWRLRHLEDERSKKTSAKTAAGAAASDLPATAPSGDDEPSLGLAGQLLRDRARPEDSIDSPRPLGADDDGWEDPAAEIPELRAAGVLPSLLPPPPSRPAPAEAPDGWEDPVQEIEGLRERGVLPPAAPPSGTEPSEPTLSEPSALPSVDDPDEPVLGPVLIGSELAAELSVPLGAEVQLITPIGRLTPAGEVPGILGARVGGIFFSGMYAYDRRNVYAPLALVQRFLLTQDRVSGVEVKLTDVDDIDRGKAEVERIVAAIGRDDELMVEDWRDLNRSLFSAMFLEKVAMFIALLFVVLVASFGILASNLMSVMEKSKEIAILKAMGMSDGGILRVFMAEGLCVGIVGGFGGIGMGLALCWALGRYGMPLNDNVYYIQELPVVVNPLEVMLVGVAALLIVCISSLYPALVAARLRPVDALRHVEK